MSVSGERRDTKCLVGCRGAMGVLVSRTLVLGQLGHNAMVTLLIATSATRDANVHPQPGSMSDIRSPPRRTPLHLCEARSFVVRSCWILALLSACTSECTVETTESEALCPKIARSLSSERRASLKEREHQQACVRMSVVVRAKKSCNRVGASGVTPYPRQPLM